MKVTPLPEILARADSQPDQILAEEEHDGYPTEAAAYIGEVVLPDFWDSFLKKNADYGDSYQSLGAAGQFGEIWRKVPKLKRSMWDGHKLTGEQPREILMDLIGHCLLAIRLIDSGNDNTPGRKS